MCTLFGLKKLIGLTNLKKLAMSMLFCLQYIYIYIASINHYERILNKLQQNPYPITLDKTHRFLVYTKKINVLNSTFYCHIFVL